MRHLVGLSCLLLVVACPVDPADEDKKIQNELTAARLPAFRALDAVVHGAATFVVADGEPGGASTQVLVRLDAEGVTALAVGVDFHQGERARSLAVHDSGLTAYSADGAVVIVDATTLEVRLNLLPDLALARHLAWLGDDLIVGGEEAASRRPWLARMSKDGELRWSKVLERTVAQGSIPSGVAGMVVHTDKIGVTWSTWEQDADEQDAYFGLLDSDGVMQRQWQINRVVDGLSHWECFPRLNADADGAYLLTSESRVMGCRRGGEANIVLRFNAQGEVLAKQALGGTIGGFDSGGRDDGKLLLAGWLSPTVPSQGLVLELSPALDSINGAHTLSGPDWNFMRLSGSAAFPVAIAEISVGVEGGGSVIASWEDMQAQCATLSAADSPMTLYGGDQVVVTPGEFVVEPLALQLGAGPALSPIDLEKQAPLCE